MSNINYFKTVNYKFCYFCRKRISENEFDKHIKKCHRGEFKLKNLNDFEIKEGFVKVSLNYRVLLFCDSNSYDEFHIIVPDKHEYDRSFRTTKGIYEYDLSSFLSEHPICRFNLIIGDQCIKVIVEDNPYDLSVSELKECRYYPKYFKFWIKNRNSNSLTSQQMLFIAKIYKKNYESLRRIIMPIEELCTKNDLCEFNLLFNLSQEQDDLRLDEWNTYSKDEFMLLKRLLNGEQGLMDEIDLLDSSNFKSILIAIQSILNNDRVNYLFSRKKIKTFGFFNYLFSIIDLIVDDTICFFNRKSEFNKKVNDLCQLEVYREYTLVNDLLLICNCLVKDQIITDDFYNQYKFLSPIIAIQYSRYGNDPEGILRNAIHLFPNSQLLKEFIIQNKYTWIMNYIDTNEYKLLLNKENLFENYSRNFIDQFPFDDSIKAYSLVNDELQGVILELDEISIALDCVDLDKANVEAPNYILSSEYIYDECFINKFDRSDSIFVINDTQKEVSYYDQIRCKKTVCSNISTSLLNNLKIKYIPSGQGVYGTIIYIEYFDKKIMYMHNGSAYDGQLVQPLNLNLIPEQLDYLIINSFNTRFNYIIEEYYEDVVKNEEQIIFKLSKHSMVDQLLLLVEKTNIEKPVYVSEQLIQEYLPLFTIFDSDIRCYTGCSDLNSQGIYILTKKDIDKLEDSNCDIKYITIPCGSTDLKEDENLLKTVIKHTNPKVLSVSGNDDLEEVLYAFANNYFNKDIIFKHIKNKCNVFEIEREE